MSAGDDVRCRINTVEVALKEAGTENTVHTNFLIAPTVFHSLPQPISVTNNLY
jgi:hypothetical protein